MCAFKSNCRALLLIGKPHDQPVVQYGPFAVNT
ncbi:MAG: pirin-like C-terminal cupin domain-containing protein [Wenzhouxiangellaceae bacterium]